MKLQDLLKIIEPLPWKHRGATIEGTAGCGPLLPPIIAIVEDQDDPKDDAEHAAYLTHAANHLPELMEALSALEVNAGEAIALTAAGLDVPAKVWVSLNDACLKAHACLAKAEEVEGL